MGIETIYLWGRSMGASTILNLIKTQRNDPKLKEIIKLVILDSPFASFLQISK